MLGEPLESEVELLVLEQLVEIGKLLHPLSSLSTVRDAIRQMERQVEAAMSVVQSIRLRRGLQAAGAKERRNTLETRVCMASTPIE